MDPITIISAALLGGFISGGQSEEAVSFNGCEVELIEGTNAYQFVDPTCAPFNGGGSSQAGHDGSTDVLSDGAPSLGPAPAPVRSQTPEERQAYLDALQERRENAGL